MSAAWLKFYPSDWRADPALRMCSIAARGLWMEMLCVMHEATPRGSLLVNGMEVTDKQLAGLAGVSVREVTMLLAELESSGVFSRDNGTIYSRRMRKDTDKAERDKANGKGGGNPTLKVGVNPPDKAQKPEARDQTQKETSLREVSAARSVELDKLEAELREAAGLENETSPSLLNLSPMIALLESGYDLSRDILPKLREAKARGKHGRTWTYYVASITENKSANDAIPAKHVPAASDPVVWINEDDPRFKALADRHEAQSGRKIRAAGSRYENGIGAHFPADWVSAKTSVAA